MIQRVQSFYLLLTIAALIIITLGTDVFVTIVNKKGQYEIISHGNVYGIQKDLIIKGNLEHENANLLKATTGIVDLKDSNDSIKGIPTYYFPFYSITIVLTVLAAATLFSFKNLRRQIKLGRLLFIFNLILFGTSIFMYYLLKSHSLPNADEEIVQYYLGFYCICIAVAFSFLSNLGIRRDLKLIQSIDRIR